MFTTAGPLRSTAFATKDDFVNPASNGAAFKGFTGKPVNAGIALK